MIAMLKSILVPIDTATLTTTIASKLFDYLPSLANTLNGSSTITEDVYLVVAVVGGGVIAVSILIITITSAVKYNHVAVVPPPPPDTPPPPVTQDDFPPLDQETIETFRVVDLKEELRRRGLLVTGNKAELVKRLTEASCP